MNLIPNSGISIAFQKQTASIPAMTICNLSISSLLRISYYIEVVGVVSDGTLALSFSWTDDNGVQSRTSVSELSLTSLGYASGSLVIFGKPNSSVTTIITLNGITTGSPQYNLYISIESLFGLPSIVAITPPTEESIYYASPSGVSTNAGTYASPMDLATALSGTGRIVYLRDGVYTMDVVTINSNNIVSNAPSERPVITNSSGLPPRVVINAGANISGVWFGGTKDTEDSTRSIDFIDGSSVVAGCTFFGYSNGMVGHVEQENLIKQNRFVNCGLGDLIHDIYVSGPPSNSQCGSTIKENIHLGGAGYKLQLYHEPTWITIHANFYSNSNTGDMAIQQGDDTITNNILWDCNSAYQYWNAGSCVFNKNIIGPSRVAFTDVTTESNSADGNVFCNGQTAFGTNSHTWTDTDIASNLGYNTATINSAVSDLITRFGNSVATIQADATIETDFAVLKSVVDAWKNQ